MRKFINIYLRFLERNEPKLECSKSTLLPYHAWFSFKKVKCGEIDWFPYEICKPLSIFELYKCPVCNGFFHEWNKVLTKCHHFPPRIVFTEKKRVKKSLSMKEIGKFNRSSMQWIAFAKRFHVCHFYGCFES